MNRIRRVVPSPALAVAVLALVAALAGTAVAGPDATTSINKKRTKKISRLIAKKQVNKKFPVENEDLANPLYSAVVAASGNLVRGNGVSSSTRLATGLYETRFDTDLSGCSWVAQIGSPTGVPVASGEISTSLRSPGDSEGLLHIVNNSNGVVADKPFHVLVYC